MSKTTFTDKAIDRIRNINHGNFFNYLSSAYEVLRAICSHLPLQDLETVAGTFEGWKPVVETIKRERTDLESFVIYPRSDPFEIWSEATFCLAFCLVQNKNLENKLKKYLTKNASFLTIESRAGIIGTNNDLSKLIQKSYSNFASLNSTSCPTAYLRIPKIPDVGIKTFTWKRNICFKEFRDSFSLPHNKIIKCLLILVTLQDNIEASEQKDDFVSYLQTTQSEEFAVGGCLVDFLIDDSDEDTKTVDVITKYIVFFGDKVEAASIVLKGNMTAKRDIELAVEELRMISPKTKKGILFVFRCCSRQTKSRKYIYEWEGNSITKNFPSVPIVGCFGYGEFGKKFPDKEYTIHSSKRAKQSKIWEYSFATSIVYVGFNI